MPQPIDDLIALGQMLGQILLVHRYVSMCRRGPSDELLPCAQLAREPASDADHCPWINANIIEIAVAADGPFLAAIHVDGHHATALLCACLFASACPRSSKRRVYRLRGRQVLSGARTGPYALPVGEAQREGE